MNAKTLCHRGKNGLAHHGYSTAGGHTGEIAAIARVENFYSAIIRILFRKQNGALEEWLDLESLFESTISKTSVATLFFLHL